MLYLDRDGKLKSRIQAIDSNDELQRELARLVKEGQAGG
jgi:hypothetical protein